MGDVILYCVILFLVLLGYSNDIMILMVGGAGSDMPFFGVIVDGLYLPGQSDVLLCQFLVEGI